MDEGNSWEYAELDANPFDPYAWTMWSCTWTVTEPGEYTICSRAADSNGRVQPPEAVWNRKGYGYNAVYKVNVKVE